VVRESITTLVRDVEDRTTLAEMEARERVSRVEMESATMLTFAHEEAEALLGGSPFSRVSLRRRTELERWPRRTPEACPTQWLMVISDERSLRGSLGNILRSSPFYRPRLRAMPCHS
jgi:hypothetical protein